MSGKELVEWLFEDEGLENVESPHSVAEALLVLLNLGSIELMSVAEFLQKIAEKPSLKWQVIRQLEKMI